MRADEPHLLDLPPMLVLSIIASLLFAGYSLLILVYWRGWTKVPVFDPAQAPSTSISIIIPARNESANIGNLLRSIQLQAYPPHLLQVIVIDDHSSDDTAAIAGTFSFVTVLRLTDTNLNSYKKNAVEKGIALATGELIICTDADCIPSPLWLQTMVGFYEKTGAAFIAAPVMIRPEPSGLALFQAMDFLVLQGITAASVQLNMHAMCNGANMAYKRSAFYAVEGFKEIDHLASGDDMLLMYKIRRHFPNDIKYLLSKNAIMYTGAQETIGRFFNQRIRWASKATSYQEKNMLPVLALVYFFNLLFPVLLITSVFHEPILWLVMVLWIAKTIVELPFYMTVSGFYNMRWTAWLLFPFQPFHILYTVLSGFLGQFRSYEWKGRKVS